MNQRKTGWLGCVAGGSKAINKAEEATHIKKALASQSYEQRRCSIDQGMKLASAINDIVAVGGGAIAGRWHSRWRVPGYQYRPDHRERDEHIYTIRGNWAIEKGLMKVGESGYTDQITQPAEEVYCSCRYEYIYSLRDLPESMITAKGRSELVEARKKIAAM